MHKDVPKLKPVHPYYQQKPHTGSLMDSGDSQTSRKQNNPNLTVSRLKAPSTGSRFPYKWGAIVPNLSTVQDSNCSRPLAYIWVSSWSTHMTLIYLMDILQKMLLQNRFFWSLKYICQESPHSAPNPSWQQVIFWLIYEANSQDSFGSLSKQITRNTNIVIRENFMQIF